MTREEWLQSLTVGSFAIESSIAGHKTVQISEIKKGRIWYSNVYTCQGGIRCVNRFTGFSHDMKHHILPQTSEEPEENNDNINDFYSGTMP
jgi:hypothetical protein